MRIRIEQKSISTVSGPDFSRSFQAAPRAPEPALNRAGRVSLRHAFVVTAMLSKRLPVEIGV